MEEKMGLAKFLIPFSTIDSGNVGAGAADTAEEDMIGDLCGYVVKTNYEELPPAVIEWAKKSIIDTLACIIAGSSDTGCKEIVDLVKDWAGKEESTIPVYGGKVPAQLAAFASGPMARARDLGDVHEEAGHVAEYVLPSLLAASELRGGVTGKEFITAHVLGCEVLCRVGNACHAVSYGTKYGVYSPYRVWGPTAAVAKVLGLDKDTLWNAIGLSMPSDMTLQAVVEGALLIRVEHGFICEQAIKAVMLARKGISGIRNVLQGKKGGFFKVFYNLGEPKPTPELVVAGLGNTFEANQSSFKPYPSCKSTHSTVSAGIDLVGENNIAPGEIEEVSCQMAPVCYELVCQPKDVKWNPQTKIDSQFSMPYSLATGIITGNVGIADFGEEAVWRPEIRTLMEKVKAEPDPEIPGLGARVTIKTKEGQEFTKEVIYVKGHPENPMSMDDMIAKFRSCVPFSARPLPEKNTERLIELLTHLEEVKDVTQIIKLLAP